LQSPISDPRPLGRELYDIIFKPVATELKKTGAQILMWSLDDNLRYVPMAALWDGEKYLVESYQNVSFTRADSARMTRDVSRKWSGVAFGNSRPQVVDVSDSMVPFPGLPSVTKELSTIFNPQPTGTTGITKGEIFIDKRFTKETFYRALRGRPSLVHISSHFSIRPGDDTRSFLLLGDGATLTLSEMEKQRRLFEGVELLVLSACNTAATQPNAMDREVDGFAELAQRLGADAVVSTLWQSSDAATSHLMQKFYATLKSTSEMTKAEALRQAQLELLNGAAETEPLVEVSGGMSNAEPIISDEPKQNRHGNEKTQGNVVYVRPKDVPPFKGAAGKPFAHPHYWAPFILIGNWK
jgi:CHAT domain-containing protein